MATPVVYRTKGGIVLRILEADDGGLRVQVLKEGAWEEGRIGMVGLRLSPDTIKLTARETSALPK